MHYATSPPVLLLFSAVLYIRLYFQGKVKARIEKSFKQAEAMLDAERDTAEKMFGDKAKELRKASAAEQTRIATEMLGDQHAVAENNVKGLKDSAKSTAIKMQMKQEL